MDSAREALARATANVARTHSKGAELAAQSAQEAYNAAVAARLASIKARVNEIAIKSAIGPQDTAPAPALAAPLAAEHDALIAEFRSLSIPFPSFASPWEGFESEPNNSAATADIMSIFATGYTIRHGSITAGDDDFFRFTAAAGSRIWAMVDTGGPSNPGATTRDSILTLLDTDGATVIEVDDDDGVANGGDFTTEGALASAIAGRLLPADGTYYLHVNGFSATGVIDPYSLIVLVTPPNLSIHAEDEPNETFAAASPLIGSLGSGVGILNGNLVAAENDVYAITVANQNLVIISADLDPQRDGTNTNVAIDLLATDGTTVLMTVDSASGNPFSESLSFRSSVTGTLFVRVRQDMSGNVGNYQIAAAVVAGEPPCPPPAIGATLGQDTPDYPSIHGQQTGRLNRFEPRGSCAVGKSCPGVFTATGLRTFDAYAFGNSSGSTACVTVEVNSQDCTGTGFIFAAAYLNSFDPSNLCLNYLSDSASSPNPLEEFSFDLPAGQNVVLVFHEVNPAAGCSRYSFSVSGLGTTCLQPVDMEVDDDTTGTTISNANGVLEPGERVVVAPAWRNNYAPPLFNDNFDVLSAPALPAGWVANLAVGLGGDNPWQSVAANAHSPANSVFAADPNHITDNRLDSPQLFLPASTIGRGRLDFHHRYILENGFDGGVLEISIDGGAFQDILAAGGSFQQGGYDRVISNAHGSPIGGRMAWTGSSGGIIKTSVTLPSAASNHDIVLRWRAATDNSVSSSGWNVDTVSIASGEGIAVALGTATGLTGPGGPAYTIDDSSSQYNSVTAGQIHRCAECFEMTVAGARPILHWDASYNESLNLFPHPPIKTWTLHVGNSFTDVPTASGFYRFVETILHNGVTGGCGGNAYCPSDSVLREQMAVFLLVSKEGIGYVPPACVTPTFGDVPCANPFARWIEELVLRGVTAGCGGGNYCPVDPVTREQMAVFLLVTEEGTGYLPPACATPTFGDVPCASPFARWIEELVRRGITAGCGGGNFCPTTPVTRQEMAVFLTVNFGLELYGP